jgi:hypothetical protein
MWSAYRLGLFSFSLMVFLLVVSCYPKTDQIQVIINSLPVYEEESIVDLEKLYRIDVTEISLFNKQNEYQGLIDFDRNNNLYVLDIYEGTITVFDENGRLVNSFGRRGQGPSEFQEAHFMVISNNRIYVFHGRNELKILDLQGEHISGKPNLIFGRHYRIENFSEEARNRFSSTYEKAIEKGRMTILKAPPIVRTMFQDSNENIWVISGETYEDNMNPNFENTVDIFNRKGEWLSSFKTTKISKNSFYHHGKIYKVRPIDTEDFSQFIDVYGMRFKWKGHDGRNP